MHLLLKELPSVLATAASMASLNGSSQRVQDRVDQVLQSQHYAGRMRRLDFGIATAHQRIQNQLCELNRSSLDADFSANMNASSGTQASVSRDSGSSASSRINPTAAIGDTNANANADVAARPRRPDRRRRYSASPPPSLPGAVPLPLPLPGPNSSRRSLFQSPSPPPAPATLFQHRLYDYIDFEDYGSLVPSNNNNVDDRDRLAEPWSW